MEHHNEFEMIIPKRLKVIRLFEKNKIDNTILDPKKVNVDHKDWIPISNSKPNSTNVFYVKKNDFIFKSIFIFQYPIKLPSNWWHCVLDEWISTEDITHWMEII